MEKITQRIMLVALTVTKPKLSEKDKQVTTEVALDKQASTAAIAVIKQLYPKHLLQPIQEVEGAARRHIESLSSMSMGRMSMVPLKLLPSLLQDIGVFRLQFQQAVTVFLNNYAGVMFQAQQEQGSMFDQSAYPDLSTLKADFTFEMSYVPMGDVPNFIDGMEEADRAELQAEVEENTRKTLAAGQKEIYSRLGAAIARIKTQCSNDKGKIYDSLTGNLDEMLKVLPALNLADDPEFTRLCEEARSLVVSPVAIKTVPGVRESLASKAGDMLAQMQAMGY
jgi:hypothetical protein